jgi:hypothetical protein
MVGCLNIEPIAVNSPLVRKPEKWVLVPISAISPYTRSLPTIRALADKKRVYEGLTRGPSLAVRRCLI